MDASEGAAINPTSMALSHPGTRAACRRRLALSLVVIVLGLGLLSAADAAYGSVDHDNKELVQHGSAVTGVVEDVIIHHRGVTDAIRIAYVVDGRRYLQRVPVDHDYMFHQSVRVYYDPRSPARMTLRGEEIQSRPTLWAAAGLFAGGAAGLVWGVLSLAAWKRCRRALRRDPWRPVHVELSIAGTRVAAWITDENVEYVCRGLRTALPPVMWMFRRRPEGPVLAVGPADKRIYVADARGTGLVQFRVWNVGATGDHPRRPTGHRLDP